MVALKRAVAVLCLAGAALAAPAAAAPGDRQFVGVDRHDPSAFLRAVRAGADFVKGGRGRQFRVILANSGVIVVIPGTSTVQMQLAEATRGARGLQIIACRETIDALSKANRRRVPVLPGVTLMPCASLRNKMTVAGWQEAPGLGY